MLVYYCNFKIQSSGKQAYENTKYFVALFWTKM